MKTGTAMISEKLLNKVDRVMGNPEHMDEWMDYLKTRDRNLYMWVQERTGMILSNLAKYTHLRVSDSDGVALNILSAFLSSYIIQHLKEDEEIRAKLSPENEYEMWINGLMPEQYYDFDISGLDKNDDNYKAKTAYLRNIAKAKKALTIKKQNVKKYEEYRKKMEKSFPGNCADGKKQARSAEKQCRLFEVPREEPDIDDGESGGLLF